MNLLTKRAREIIRQERRARQLNKETIEEALESTAKMIAEIRASEEGQEGMAAFLEKRKPNWVK